MDNTDQTKTAEQLSLVNTVLDHIREVRKQIDALEAKAYEYIHDLLGNKGKVAFRFNEDKYPLKDVPDDKKIYSAAVMGSRVVHVVIDGECRTEDGSILSVYVKGGQVLVDGFFAEQAPDGKERLFCVDLQDIGNPENVLSFIIDNFEEN